MSARVARIFVLSIALAATLGHAQWTHAEETPWSTDIEGSLKQAAATGKPVLMEFSASWCVYCKRMEKTTFTDPEVAARIKDQFVFVRVDADKNKDLVTDLSIKGLPAILVVSPELKIIERISGFQTPDALLARLDRVPAAGKPSAPDAGDSAGAKERPAGKELKPKTRSETTFEPVNREGTAPQRKVDEVRPVSRPAIVSRNSSQDAEFFREQNPADSRSGSEEFFNSVSTNRVEVAETSRMNPGTASGKPAFRGSCLVSAVEERAIIPGDAQFQVTYRGNVLYFQSEDHQQQFLAQPEKYWPVMDGCCTITLLNENRTVEGELQYAAVFRKRIWLFLTQEEMQEFFKDPAEVAEEIAEQYPSP